MMVSLEAEAIRTRLKYNIDTTSLLQATRARRRVEYEAALGRSGQLPAGVQVAAVAVGPLLAEWVRAPAAAPDRVLLYLHGGGYAMGSCASHRLLAATLSQVTGWQLLVLDYRLAPEHPFPAALEDAAAAYHWLLDGGIHPEHLVLAGDSAGGGLALATLVLLRETGASLPARAVLLSPWTDLALSSASLLTQAERDALLTPDYLREEAQAYLGARDPRTPLASPLYADLHGLPPLLVQVGGDEILLDDATRVTERATGWCGGQVVDSGRDVAWLAGHSRHPTVPGRASRPWPDRGLCPSLLTAPHPPGILAAAHQSPCAESKE